MKSIIYPLTHLTLFLVVLSFTACNRETPKISLVGNWYCKREVSGYSEIYFSDSLCSAQNEAGYKPPIRYHTKNDSVYIQEFSGDFFAIFKILKLKDDTLLLESKDQQKISKELWIRFPKDEFGRFGLRGTPEAEDSLGFKTIMNYDRRKRKFHSLESNDFKEYDSLIKINYWKWNTKTQERILAEKLQRIEDRLNELEKKQ